MVDEPYCPDKGDLIWLNFDPQAGREQAGRRPAIVLSPKNYNQKTYLVIACPITSQIKGYPFEVPLSEGGKMKGVVLSDHVRSLDWKIRQSQYIETIDNITLKKVLEKLEILISF